MTLNALDQARCDDALNRMKELDDCLERAAELMYRARALATVDSLSRPWGLLTDVQRKERKTELWKLIFQKER